MSKCPVLSGIEYKWRKDKRTNLFKFSSLTTSFVPAFITFPLAAGNISIRYKRKCLTLNFLERTIFLLCSSFASI